MNDRRLLAHRGCLQRQEPPDEADARRFPLSDGGNRQPEIRYQLFLRSQDKPLVSWNGVSPSLGAWSISADNCTAMNEDRPKRARAPVMTVLQRSRSLAFQATAYSSTSVRKPRWGRPTTPPGFESVRTKSASCTFNSSFRDAPPSTPKPLCTGSVACCAGLIRHVFRSSELCYGARRA